MTDTIQRADQIIHGNTKEDLSEDILNIISELLEIVDGHKYKKDLQHLIDVQCADGTGNCNSYMHGIANGLICAMSVLTGDEPNYMKEPKEWLDDKPSLPPIPKELE